MRNIGIGCASALVMIATLAPAQDQSANLDKSTEALSEILGPITKPLKACATTTTPSNSGVIRIIMPKSPDFTDIQRRVKYELVTYDENITDDSANDNKGTRNGSKKDEPFHIFADNIPLDQVAGRYLLVKVIIRNTKDSGFTFYDEADAAGIHGVGVSDDSQDVVCGNRPIVEKGGNRQVAKFLIDVTNLKSKLQANPKYFASFNIGIRLNEYPDTPIFIDPKIHNEG